MTARVSILAVGICITVGAGAVSLHQIHRSSDALSLRFDRGTTYGGQALLAQCDKGDDTLNAYCEFEQLTNATAEWTTNKPLSSAPGDPTNTQTLPLWTHWADKCYLVLSPCARGRNAHWKEAPKAPADLLSMSLPIQIPSPNKADKYGSKVRDIHAVPGHELASVLFSPQMETEAKRLNHNASLNAEWTAVTGKPDSGREIASTHLVRYSTVTKLIWQVVLPGENSPFPAYVFDSKPGAIPTLENGTRFDDPAKWTTQYDIDGSETMPCQPSGQLPMPTSSSRPMISINCFFHYTVDSNDDAVWNQLTSDLQIGIHTSSSDYPPRSGHAVVLLVGVHLMRFDSRHQQWQWMTFYWTKDSNGQSTWKNPWQHYSMETASVKQLGKKLTQEPLANPYLEGNIDKHGRTTNCISCHSLAAYSPAGGKRVQAIKLIDSTPCDGTHGKPCYPATEDAAHNGSPSYYSDAIRTHFIWSIATNPCLPQIPATDPAITQLCPANIPATRRRTHPRH